MKALIYARVSTASQADEGTSLDSQVSECASFAEKLGADVVHVTKEVFSGAYLFDRPLLNEQREHVRRGIYDAVIVYSIDRLSRDIAHLAIISDEFERHNTKLLFVTENLDDTPEGKLLRSVKSYVAEVEREKIKERCVRGKRTKILQGKFVPASNLFGYAFDKTAGKRTIIETEAETVRRIFSSVLKGASLKRIAAGLNADPVPPPSATRRKFKNGHLAKWQTSTLRRILGEPAYAGKTFAWRFKRVNGFRFGKRTSKVELRDESEWVELPGITPPVVSQKTWDAANRKIKENAGERVRNESLPYLLRGIIFCSVCDRKMYPDAERGHRFYRCSSKSVAAPCGGKRVNAEQVETAIWKIFVKYLQKPELIEAALKKAQIGNAEKTRLSGSLEENQKRIKNLETEIKNLVARAATADNSLWTLFEEQIKTKQSEKDKLSNAAREIESLIGGDREKRTEIFTLVERFRAKTADASFEVRRKILESFDAKIYGSGKNYKLYTVFYA